MICSTSNIIEGKMTSSCYSKDVIKEQYKNEYKIVKNALKKIEENYNIIFNEDEICFIIRNIMSI